jgi:hypothetical protein
MAFPAKPRARLFFLSLILLMAGEALVMKGPLKIDSRLRGMTGRTFDLLIPLLKRAFIQHIFSILVLMVTIFTRESLLTVPVMREVYRRSFPFHKNFRMIQLEMVLLGHEARGREG